MKLSEVLLSSMLMVGSQAVAQTQNKVEYKQDTVSVQQIQYQEHLIIKEMGYNPPEIIQYGPAGEPIVRKYRCAFCGMG